MKEFESNNEIAFTTIPHTGNEHVRARGVVRKSKKTIFNLAEVFGKKIKVYANIIEQAGEFLVLYEISFTSANVILNFENADIIEL